MRKSKIRYVLFGAIAAVALGLVVVPTLEAQQTPQYLRIKNQGVLLTRRFLLNFTGGGVSCSDNAGLEETDCVINGGGGGGSDGGSGGTVTSVAVVAPLSPTTITGSGTVAFPTETAHTALLGPTSGSAATPIFRTIANADLPATAVTPGAYTSANITVNQQGLITAAANGSAGISLPNGQVGYGNGSTIVSNSSFTADGSGNVVAHSITGTTGFTTLDLYDPSQLADLRLANGGNLSGFVGPDSFIFGAAGLVCMHGTLTGGCSSGASLFETTGVLRLGYSSGPTNAGDIGWSGTSFVGSTTGASWDVTLGGGGGITWPLTNGTSTNTYSSAVTDSSSAVAHDFNTTHAFGTAGDKLLRIRNNGTEEAFFDRNGGLNFGAAGANGQIVPSGSGINYTSDSDSLFTWGGQNLTYSVTFHTIYPNLEIVNLGGAPSNRFNGISAYQYDTKLGAQLTAASTITPTSALHHITGATPITTIAVTNLSAGNVNFTGICDVTTCTFSTGGNIAIAVTVPQNKAQVFTYDASVTTWYPQQ